MALLGGAQEPRPRALRARVAFKRNASDKDRMDRRRRDLLSPFPLQQWDCLAAIRHEGAPPGEPYVE